MPSADENNLPTYIVITPAHNEEKYIEKVIKSMIAQTVLPVKWIIASDGSTDNTNEIVASYGSQFPWIELLPLPQHQAHSFAAKVNCFNTAYHTIKDLNFDIIGNLDADISFEHDYFEFLLKMFAQNPMLGVAGTPFIENRSQYYDYRYTNIEHVSGACQLFRKDCFTEIGGYQPVKYGGIDWIAVTTARMKGWKTRTFTEKYCVHHRPIGRGKTELLKIKFRYGQKDYLLGGHPIWEIFRSAYQMKFKPYLIGGLLMLAGYTWSSLRRVKRPISNELLSFNRNEQAIRLQKIVFRLFQCRCIT